jgi:hypothetical protein
MKYIFNLKKINLLNLKIRFYFKMESKSYTTCQEIEDYLNSINFQYKKYTHNAVLTMEDMKNSCKFDHSPYIKNRFMQDKKKNFYLVVSQVDTPE